MASLSPLAPLVDFVFPPRCPICGEGVSTQGGLCVGCWGNLVIPGKPACDSCGTPFSGEGIDNVVCVPCRIAPPLHDGITAATIYNDTSRKLVLAIKHGGRIALGPMMARLIAARIDMEMEGWVAVPVPLHRWRLWRRGFNQAAILAREIARLKGAGLCVDALVRTRSTPSLGGLGAPARANALAGAIRINETHRNRVAGARILLVDDVLTSGATSDQCVSVLKQAGADQVVIACFARVLDKALEPI